MNDILLFNSIKEFNQCIEDLNKQQSNIEFAIEHSKLNCYYFHPARSDYFKTKIKSLKNIRINFLNYKGELKDFENLISNIDELINSVQLTYDSIMNIVQEFKQQKNATYTPLLESFKANTCLSTQFIDKLSKVNYNQILNDKQDANLSKKDDANDEYEELKFEEDNSTSLDTNNDDIVFDYKEEKRNDDYENIYSDSKLQKEMELIKKQIDVEENSARVKNISLLETLKQKLYSLKEKRDSNKNSLIDKYNGKLFVHCIFNRGKRFLLQKINKFKTGQVENTSFNNSETPIVFDYDEYVAKSI